MIDRMEIAKSIESCVLIPEESDFLIKYAEKAKHGLVELGSLYGRSSVILGDVAERLGLELLCVDNWADINVHERWLKHIEMAKLCPTLKFCLGDSVEAGKAFGDSECLADFLFIDAGHVYESVRADFETWEKVLTRPAYVVFHDINIGSVRKYFDELTQDHEHEILNNIGMIKLEEKRKE